MLEFVYKWLLCTSAKRGDELEIAILKKKRVPYFFFLSNSHSPYSIMCWACGLLNILGSKARF